VPGRAADGWQGIRPAGWLDGTRGGAAHPIEIG